VSAGVLPNPASSRPVAIRGPGRLRRSVTTMEIAEAAALGDLAAAMCVLTRLVPAGDIGTLLAAFPVAVLGYRRRARVCSIAVMTAFTVAFLGGGIYPAASAVAAGALGSLIGIGLRRRWSVPRIVGTGALALGVPAAAIAVGVFSALTDLRVLALAQLTNAWAGVVRLGEASGLPRPVLDAGQALVSFAVTRWWLLLLVLVTVGVLVWVLVATVAFRSTVRRVQPLLPRTRMGDLDASGAAGTVVAPLPVRLAGVGVRYEGSAEAALAGVDLTLEKGRLLAVTGPNGSGKSTLGRVLAGQTPTDGTVDRPGSAGLGAPGGTGVIFQRPESQVLGVRVVDDLLWGTDNADIDVDGLLARVGLAGFADRETSTLSGGELQRLAVAGLLARRPSMVISDESTAMLDPAGRADVVELMHGLVRDDGVTIVHISHTDEVTADHTLDLGDDQPSPAPPTGEWRSAGDIRGARVEVRGADLVHDAGTPWQHPVLAGVDLDIPAGHTVLVTGPNGAGKSTLAWMLAGLLAPTAGTVTLDGRPLHNGRDGALLGIQHPRLALLRATVCEDVRDAAGTDEESAYAALRAVGLDPDRFGDRPVHELSGGEQRRVMLAGLLAARPRVLVLDEPLAGLDKAARNAVREALHALRAAGVTLIIVTHDTAALDDLADATLTVAEGRVEGPLATPPLDAPPRDNSALDPPAAPALRSRPRRRDPARPKPSRGSPSRAEPSRPKRARTVMRTLPGSSPAHRLWAGTKIGMLLALAVVPAVNPSWPTLAAAALVLAAWTVAGRVPRGTWPKLPPWLLLVVGGSAALTALGNEPPPLVSVLGFTISLGALNQAALFLGIMLISLIGSTILVWTTPISAIPPLLQRLAAWGRHIRLPLARLSAAIALGLRLAPMLLDDSRTILHLLGQRRRSRPGDREHWRQRLSRFTGGAFIACAAAVRRAAETADALTARGGIGTIAGPDQRPGVRDLLAALFAAGILTVGVLL
jgi:energy-coupling factor transport system permease/ATP-binding protein